ncbi:proteasome accessory factor PafA2 [Janibacter sp. YIM B02568]|uniref:depupylase/deamidase Dop n=1 Tax=Janibacter endophyticus TaxID=2806261 RepID=UPI0019512EE6|nr:depupylase/deamidase Dop [Janibacter endophyticus]MBM6546393.1 proteasome accessory factor PafA2 [Janibacter endophyticus]
MTVRRIMGIETEYGIAVPGQPWANPIETSGIVVSRYARAHGLRATHGAWDYSDEQPLVDARGFSMPRADAHPSQLTDEDDPSLANVVLPNGARLYVDHAHPEYSTPEVTTPRDALVHDRAGELVMREAVALVAAGGTPYPEINLYKNNTDGKGQSYGTHENYLIARESPFDRVVRDLTPFFVARQVIIGAGRVGLGRESEGEGYQVCSRADFFEAEVGLETTFRRPIINTRDEPHADPDRYRRLHVIVGDANLAEVAGLLKIGVTSLVLTLIEADAVRGALTLREPLRALREVSHDPTCTALVELSDGRRMTAVQLLWAYRELIGEHLEQRGSDPATDEVLGHLDRVLSLLERDPMSAARDLDWVAKLALLQGYRDRDGLSWGDPRLRAIDIQYSDVRPDKGIFARLEAAGRVTRLTTPEEVETAVGTPPADTRAWLRGGLVAHHPGSVISASWDSVVLRVPRGIARVSMPEPTAFGREQTAGALAHEDILDVVADLERLA